MLLFYLKKLSKKVPNLKFCIFLFLIKFWCAFCFLWIDCVESFRLYVDRLHLFFLWLLVKLDCKWISGHFQNFNVFFSFKFNAVSCKIFIFMGYWWIIKKKNYFENEFIKRGRYFAYFKGIYIDFLFFIAFWWVFFFELIVLRTFRSKMTYFPYLRLFLWSMSGKLQYLNFLQIIFFAKYSSLCIIYETIV